MERSPVIPGRIAENVTSPSNPREHYAVYLPSSYSPDRRWPLLLLMDPRGKALIPMERVREVAERLGYLVMSSYNTRSDEYQDPNADALNAMIADAQQQYAVDPHRLYLVGQSGTARASWIYGYGLRGNVAGLIGFGAALPEGFVLTPRAEGSPPPLVFFGAAGTTDYNFDEMWSMDTTLDRVNLPHRVTFFDGPHTWPPAATLTEGVEWVELQAMKYGLKPADTAWIETSLAREFGRAADLLQAGDVYHAWQRYRGIVSDYTGLGDVRVARDQLERLERDPALKRIRQRLADNVEREQQYNAHLASFLGDFRESEPPPLEKSLKRVQLEELRRRAADPADSVTSQAAQRGLANLWVYASFYEPMDYLAKGDPRRALAILDVAQAMRPADGDVCFFQARALARLGREGEAIGAVECAVRGGVDPDRLVQTPDLAVLRSEPAYQALLARVRGRRPPRSPASGG